MDADVIVVGAGLAGLVATSELVAKGYRVAVVDQENAANLGGQAWWSFGGMFLVNSPEQRRMGIKDSIELAWQDWQGSAQWDRLDGEGDQDHWAKRWGRAYVEWAAGEKRNYLRDKGIRFTPLVGWAERGDGRATGHGNSVPRFHVSWGTGTGVIGPFVDIALEAAQRRLVRFYHRHRVDELVVTNGAVTGVRGSVLAPDESERGVASSREVVGDFELSAQAVVVAAGGIGGNHEIVREFWPERLGRPPRQMITGVPAYVDGRMLGITEQAGARLVNRDRMWHYVEGIRNWDPVWPDHAIRILSAPSPMWLDALGRPLPAPYLPSYDTLGTLRYLRTKPELAAYDHSWFVLTTTMAAKEFALSGSEQNPDITDRDMKLTLKQRISKGPTAPVQAFIDHGADFVTAATIGELVAKMNDLTEAPLLDAGEVERVIRARDREIDNPFTKDASVQAIHNARRYRGDRLARVTAPHRILDPDHGPLIGVMLHTLTRKTLGGVQTDLASRALDGSGAPIPGLYAAGETAGFGGGGVHGYNALEGTFLGGCIFSGRAAGRSLAADLG
ncbi:FAD-binding dehydrogenase [Calidifontibacter sp. DB0510]|uniref:FAD-binding dehydrogenase n=1 Tax=Metallococcus carri TaxID=1656884 RepID=A0A967EFX0_9MICO|nr:FAD-binding dehydrogenase [Metallococcus carri]NHN57016.1 FAD-binding dehydrogenase [Metallococcus carri]NOP39115.1 FAD-binding dehydrogenase [Calidifontibacter sp. DB2511S]